MSIRSLTKEIIRRFLRSRGKEIVPIQAWHGPAIPLFPLLIEHWARAEPGGWLVQIGANDGMMEDPVRESIVALGIPALLVEPLPDRFERLRSNYAEQPNILYDNVAISDRSGDAQLFRIQSAATHLPEFVHGLARFDKAVLLKHRDWPGVDALSFEHSIEAVPVQVVTFAGLLQRHPDIKKVGVLQVDTEGHDYLVVKSSIDAGCHPRLIHYEHKHLSYYDQFACRDLLASHGYSFWADYVDTLAWRTRDA